MSAPDFTTGTIFRHNHRFVQVGDVIQAVVKVSETEEEAREIKVLAIERGVRVAGAKQLKAKIDYEVVGIPERLKGK